jgi:hypothetical protein
MSRLPQHVEDELQAFLELLCPSAIMFKSQMPSKRNFKHISIRGEDWISYQSERGNHKVAQQREKGVANCERRDSRTIQDSESLRWEHDCIYWQDL